MVPSAEMIAIARKLQGWRGLEFFGATEVLTWYRGRTPAFALRGPALRIENRLFRTTQGMVPNRRHAFDVDMQRALGMDARLAPGGYGVDGGAGQTLSDPDAHYSEVTAAIEGIAAEALGTDTAHVTVMPAEGAPWNPGEAATPFWNAKKQRMFEGRAPEGLIQVELDGETLWGVDPCKHSPFVRADEGGAIVGRVPTKFVASRREPLWSNTNLVATHCLSLDRAQIMGAAEAIRSCGGLLFPSIAVGELPATTFGPLCLVLRFGIVLEGLAPYKKGRGAWPIVVYKTDAWTGGVTSFIRGGAVVLFEQLTGAWEASPYASDHGVVTAHQWVLGPSISETGFMGEAVPLLRSTKQLAQSIGARTKLWKRDITPERMESLSERPKDRYPYLEAKSAAVVALSAAPLALVPAMLQGEAQTFLATAGWAGDLVTVQTPSEWNEVLAGRLSASMVSYQYAWLLHDLIVDYATKRGLATEIVGTNW